MTDKVVDMDIAGGFKDLKSSKQARLAGRKRFSAPINRRELLKISGPAIFAGLSLPLTLPARSQARRPKKVIVGGGGIAGLACAYELMKRGHEVTLLEASGRAGGHVKTVHDPFPDGLYADAGAEHVYFPAYKTYRRYAEEFKLSLLPYPRRMDMLRFFGGKMYTEEDLHSRSVLGGLGFSQPEIDYLTENPWWNIPLLYLQKYVDRIQKENTPFGWGIDDLDQMTVTDLLKREGASWAALRYGGMYGGSSGSALVAAWNVAIRKLRSTPLLFSRELFRIKDGNQRMTDGFVTRLGARIWLGCPITAIEQGASGVTVTCRRFGELRKIEADYLVCCMSAVMLRQIPVTPAWPEDKAYPILNMPYYTVARVIFQSRTKFWERDGLSPNMEFDDPALNDCWRMAEEVESKRGILIGTAAASASAEEVLTAFRKYYPGKSEDIEQAVVVNWATHPWAMGCERVSYPPGQLHRFWPKVIEPFGRIHFSGAYAANMPWGQEAALESANRAAEEVDAA